MKRIYFFLVALMASVAMHAQCAYNGNYDVWFEGTSSEMATRKTVWCTDNFQDLWNGCYVKFTNGKTYVYDGSSYVVYGDEIALLYNGYYKVKFNDTWYLYDPQGNKIGGVYGNEIVCYPFNYVACRKSSRLWYIYRCDGEKLSFYSEDIPSICSNEYWIVEQSGKQYGIDRNGYKCSGVYGDEVSMINGRWKCVNGSYVRYVDVE